MKTTIKLPSPQRNVESNVNRLVLDKLIGMIDPPQEGLQKEDLEWGRWRSAPLVKNGLVGRKNIPSLAIGGCFNRTLGGLDDPALAWFHESSSSQSIEKRVGKGNAKSLKTHTVTNITAEAADRNANQGDHRGLSISQGDGRAKQKSGRAKQGISGTGLLEQSP